MIKPTVTVTLNARNVKTYKDLGYEIPQNTIVSNSKYGYARGATIEVKVEHLTPGAKTKVQRTCDQCQKVDFIPWREMGSRELCSNCSKSLHSQGSSNPFYGKTHSEEALAKIRQANFAALPEKEVIKFVEETGYAPTSDLTCQHFNLNRQTLLNIINRNDRRDLLFRHMSSSSFERALEALISANYSGPVKPHDRTVLTPKELDIYLPELGIAFEFNGLHWHSEEKVGKVYHYNKFDGCQKKGIQLFTIWEHIYKGNKTAVEQFIINLIKPKTKIFARKCEVVEGPEVKEFIKKWHLQGGAPAHTFLGLKYEGEVVMALSVSDHHRQGSATQVLSRVCFSQFEVIGGLERLLKRCPRPLITWSDNCYSPLGNMYKKHGFKLEGDLPPDYFYSKGDGTHFSKQSQAKRKVNCPPELREVDFARSKGLFRVWDCGKRRWRLD
jgi:hypothetical protein